MLTEQYLHSVSINVPTKYADRSLEGLSIALEPTIMYTIVKLS